MKLPNIYGEVPLDTEAIFRGLWSFWGADSPGIPGELRYSPDTGLRLRIVRHRDGPGGGLSIHGVPSTIVGSVEGGSRLIQLQHCWLQNSDFDCFDVFAMRAIVGGNDREALDQISRRVASVTFDLANVEHWLNWPRYTDDLNVSGNRPGINLASDGEKECDASSGTLEKAGGFIGFSSSIRVSGIPGGRALTAAPRVQLSFTSPKTVDDAEKAAEHTAFLLNLLIGSNSRIRSLSFDFGFDHFYRLHRSKTAIPTQEPLGRPLTMASEFDFPSILDAWLNLCGEIPNVITRLQSLLWKWSSLLDDEISVASQAMEGLGSYLYPEKYLESGAFRALKSRLMEAVEGQPDELVKRAEGTFGHLNKPSLSTLIRRLVEHLPEPNRVAVVRLRRGETVDDAVTRFVKTVNRHRNDAAHGRELESGNEPDESLLILIARMKLLLIAHLLLLAGIPLHIVSNNYRVPESWIWG